MSASRIRRRVFRRALTITLLVALGVGVMPPATPARAATFLVTNTSNTGAGSLRQAILDANLTPAADEITFNISGGGPRTIAVPAALPPNTQPVTINGWSQAGPGYTGPTLIELAGPGNAAFLSGLVITAGNSAVRGLVINSFNDHAIRLETNGSNMIQGNHIGTNVSGTAARRNGTGVGVLSGSANLIGGTSSSERNVIAGNGYAIQISGPAAGNQVVGNYIGTDPTGTIALASDVTLSFETGVLTYRSGQNTIGGATGGAGNLIAGVGRGVSINGGFTPAEDAPNNQVLGNRFGTDVTGTCPLEIQDQAIYSQYATGTVVGGPAVGAGNIIAASRMGVEFLADQGQAVLIQGNRIGVGADALASTGVGARATVDPLCAARLANRPRSSGSTSAAATPGNGSTCQRRRRSVTEVGVPISHWR